MGGSVGGRIRFFVVIVGREGDDQGAVAENGAVHLEGGCCSFFVTVDDEAEAFRGAVDPFGDADGFDVPIFLEDEFDVFFGGTEV